MYVGQVYFSYLSYLTSHVYTSCHYKFPDSFASLAHLHSHAYWLFPNFTRLDRNNFAAMVLKPSCHGSMQPRTVLDDSCGDVAVVGRWN